HLLLIGQGATLTDASGVVLAGGTITGQGAINADLSGTGVIESAGGILHLTGKVASGPTFSIINGNFSVTHLSIENTATAAAPISITDSAQTLDIGSSGNLTINGGVQNITGGRIFITTGGQLTDSAGFILGNFGQLQGSGQVTGAIGGGGIVEAGL